MVIFGQCPKSINAHGHIVLIPTMVFCHKLQKPYYQTNHATNRPTISCQCNSMYHTCVHFTKKNDLALLFNLYTTREIFHPIVRLSKSKPKCNILQNFILSLYNIQLCASKFNRDLTLQPKWGVIY